MHRRNVLLALGAAAIAGCDTAVSSGGAAVSQPTGTAKPAGSAAVSFAAMRVSDVQIDVNRGMGRPFRYGGLPVERVHGKLAEKLRSSVNAANPSGNRPARAVVRLSAITIATANDPRAKAYDSVIIANATFYDVATGEKIGTERMGAQATYRPRFAGGRDRVLAPEQELELITTHSTSVLAKQIFG